MMRHCGVVHCKNSSLRNPEKKFFRVPKVITNQGERDHRLSANRRTAWVTALRRVPRDLTPATLQHTDICEDHFVTGRPAHYRYESAINWAPTLNLQKPVAPKSLQKEIRMDKPKKHKSAKRQKIGYETDPKPITPETTPFFKGPTILQEMTSEFNWDEQACANESQDEEEMVVDRSIDAGIDDVMPQEEIVEKTVNEELYVVSETTSCTASKDQTPPAPLIPEIPLALKIGNSPETLLLEGRSPEPQSEESPPELQIEKGPPEPQVEEGPSKTQMEKRPSEPQIEESPPDLEPLELQAVESLREPQIEKSPPAPLVKESPSEPQIAELPPESQIKKSPPAARNEKSPEPQTEEESPPEPHFEKSPSNPQESPAKMQVEVCTTKSQVEESPPIPQIEEIVFKMEDMSPEPEDEQSPTEPPMEENSPLQPQVEESLPEPLSEESEEIAIIYEQTITVVELPGLPMDPIPTQSCETQANEPQRNKKLVSDVETQTPAKMDELTLYKEELWKCQRENILMREQLADMREKTFKVFDLNVGHLKVNPPLVEYFTGMPNLQEIRVFYEKCGKYVPPTPRVTMPRFNEFLMVMVKMRMNVTYKELSDRFQREEEAVAATCIKWINGMYQVAINHITWPTRVGTPEPVPKKFRAKYGVGMCATLYSFEVLIPKPLNDEACTLTWSSVKNAYTIKYLISVTPQGKISFLSDGWGGVVTDKQITEECGVLDCLEVGDTILVEKDFVDCLEGKLTSLGCSLVQWERTEDDRFHAELVVERLKEMFPILSGVIPMYLLTEKSANGMPLIDKITTICCALLNLHGRVVDPVEEEEDEDQVQVVEVMDIEVVEERSKEGGGEHNKGAAGEQS